ncbi:MAG TPA: heme o synthase [Thermoanaerobaculia bacterium]
MTVAALPLEHRSVRDLIGDYLVLSKARIVVMVLVTTAAGYWVGSSAFDPLLFLHLMIGTALVAGGTNALNQVWERDLDAQMARTRRRPLPSGRLGTRHALAFSVAISLVGIAWLAVAVNLLASFLSFATLASYLFVYTPLKTRTTHCTVIGAAPGAVPPMIGYAAATGLIDATSWALFAFLFAWQLPHFLALSWMYRDDYARGGFRMLSVGDATGATVARHAYGWSVALLAASIVPFWFGAAGAVYLVTAVAAGAALLLAAHRFAATLEMKAAKALFHGSNLYLVVVMALMMVG